MPDLCSSLIGPALCQSVDIYCERTSASVWAEPLNAVSNLAFIVAGWVAWREYRGRQSFGDDALLASIIAIIPIVGLGSFTYHTVATRWAGWADVIPILIFMLLYLWLAMRRFMGWPIGLSSVALLIFFLATIGLEELVPEQVLWGGAMYLPTVAACGVLALAPIDCAKEVRRMILAAVGLFLLSLTFRTLDMPLCARLPAGTHYLWHALNAAVLYVLVHAAILHGSPAVRSAAEGPAKT